LHNLFSIIIKTRVVLEGEVGGDFPVSGFGLPLHWYQIFLPRVGRHPPVFKKVRGKGKESIFKVLTAKESNTIFI
jgi:hypothetical protein